GDRRPEAPETRDRETGEGLAFRDPFHRPNHGYTYVFDVVQAGLAGDTPPLGCGDARLQPDGARPDLDGLLHDIRGLLAWSEYVDEIHKLRDLREGGIAPLAPDGLRLGVHRDHVPAVQPQL